MVQRTERCLSFFDDRPGNNKACLSMPTEGAGIDGLYYRLLFVNITYTSQDVSGRRDIVVILEDQDGNEIIRLLAPWGQRNNRLAYYTVLPGVNHYSSGTPAANVNRVVIMPAPSDWYLLAGGKLRVKDHNDINPASDIMVVSGEYQRIQY